MTSFIWVDFLFALVLLSSTYVGLKKGAVVDLISTVVFVLAILGGLFFGKQLGSLVFSEVNGVASPWAMPVGFIGVFVVVYLVGTFIRGSVDVSISQSKMQPADKMIGGLLGFVRGVLLILVVLGVGYWSGYNTTFERSWFNHQLDPFLNDVVAGIAYIADE